jgi:hypothetical protein
MIPRFKPCVQETENCNASSGYVNATCEEPTVVPILPYSSETNILAVSSEGYPTVSTCLSIVSPVTHSSWYKVTGQGACVIASLWSNMSAILAVYKGSDCQALSCVAQTLDGNRYVQWDAEEGQQYWMLVSGTPSYDLGEYSLTVVVGLLVLTFRLFLFISNVYSHKICNMIGT